MKIYCLVVALLALIITDAYSLPTSLLEDTKEAQGYGGSNKVKRAEEVIMFGNQQNRPVSTAAFYQNTDKRGDIGDDEVGLFSTTALPVEDYRDDDRLSRMGEDGGKSIAEYEKGYRYGVGKDELDKQAENALLKSEVLGEPASINQYRYYGGGNERQGRSERVYSVPSKRSVNGYLAIPVSKNPNRGETRMKRDLQLNEDDVLAILALLEGGGRYNLNYPYRHEVQSSYPRYNNYIPQDEYNSQLNNAIADDEDDSDDNDVDDRNEWLDGPVIPTSSGSYPAHFTAEKRPYYYPVVSSQYSPYPMQKRDGRWGGFAKNKRFWVTRKRMVDGPRDNIHSLAQLLNSTPPRNSGLPVYHRMVL